MNGWSIFFLILLILILLAYLTWIFLTQVRARRSGLPSPSWKSYFFIGSTGPAYGGGPTPRRGGVVGWVKDQIAGIRSRNRRTARGAYEERLDDGDGRDEVWDARMGSGGGGYYEEQELGFSSGPGAYAGGGYGGGGGVGGPGLGVEPQEERGRSRSRSRSRVRDDHGHPPPYDVPPTENPFGDGAERSELRDVSPRPVGAGVRKSHEHGEERRSMFRESL